MIIRTLGALAAMSGGKLNDEKYADIKIAGVSIDTRTLIGNSIYMPIIGELLDGHNFVDEAIRKGAIATFWEEGHPLEPEDFPVIRVKETTEAYQKLAHNYRMEVGATIVGITGSNGKTTTKDIASAILSQKYKVKKTIGNLNNHIGVPRTLLELDDDTEIALIEMGTERPGEIHLLADIARPDIAVFTNVGDCHLDNLGTKENIAKAKLEILDFMDEKGWFIYNGDDPYIREGLEDYAFAGKATAFGTDQTCDEVISPIKNDVTGNTFEMGGQTYKVPILGAPQMYNAAVGIILAKHFGLSRFQVDSGLSETDMSGSRSELIHCRGFDILNDSYKSNPQSLLAALETVSFLAGYKRKIAIIGDMLALGQEEADMHREIGRQINPKDIDYVLLIGDLSRYIEETALEIFPPSRVFHFNRKSDLVDKAKYLIQPSTLVLVKASRALRLEEVIEGIREINAEF